MLSLCGGRIALRTQSQPFEHITKPGPSIASMAHLDICHRQMFYEDRLVWQSSCQPHGNRQMMPSCPVAQEDVDTRPSMKDVVDRLLGADRPPVAAKSPLNDSARSLGSAARRAAEATGHAPASASVSEEESSADEGPTGPSRL